MPARCGSHPRHTRLCARSPSTAFGQPEKAKGATVDAVALQLAVPFPTKGLLLIYLWGSVQSMWLENCLATFCGKTSAEHNGITHALDITALCLSLSHIYILCIPAFFCITFLLLLLFFYQSFSHLMQFAVYTFSHQFACSACSQFLWQVWLFCSSVCIWSCRVEPLHLHLSHLPLSLHPPWREGVGSGVEGVSICVP